MTRDVQILQHGQGGMGGGPLKEAQAPAEAPHSLGHPWTCMAGNSSPPVSAMVS